MKAGSLQANIYRRFFQLGLAIVTAQMLIFMIVDLTDLRWPPTAWPWVVRERVGFWLKNPEQLGHEMREMTSLLIAGVMVLPVVLWSVRKFVLRVFTPINAVADKAREICEGKSSGRLPLGELGSANEINAMASACNLAFERYEESIRRLDHFTRETSHQLRTPLASLRMLGEISLQRQRTPDEYRETIGRMLEESARMLRAVEALLETARRDPESARKLFKRVDIPALIRDTGASFGEWKELKGLRLETECAPSLAVDGDLGLLEQAVYNLVDNAFRHTEEGGVIQILAHREGADVVIDVKDTGPGLAPDTNAHWFKSAATPADAPYEGRGLGLVIANNVMRLHGGSLVGRNREDGSGAIFTLRFPASAATAKA